MDNGRRPQRHQITLEGYISGKRRKGATERLPVISTDHNMKIRFKKTLNRHKMIALKYKMTIKMPKTQRYKRKFSDI